MRGKMNQMEEVQENGGYVLASEGPHIVQIMEIADKETKNGDPMVSMTLEVVQSNEQGRKVYDNIILSENPGSPGWKMRWRAKQFLKAIGEPHHGDSFGWDSDKWTGKRCMVNIVHEKQTQGKYAGQPRAVVKGFFPLETTVPAIAQGKLFDKEDPEVPF